jgi:queuine/archaeosine tRNA-ribosyltransferase
MKNVRESIEQDRFLEFREEFYKNYYGDEPPVMTKLD